jgi:hypothetical protein
LGDLLILYIKATVVVFVCLCGQCLEDSSSHWLPCGASPYVTSPDVIDSREKRNQGQFDFLKQKIWYTRKKIFKPWTTQNFYFIFFKFIDQDYLFFLLATIRPD